MKLNKEESRKRIRNEIRQLWAEWDPIGVYDADWGPDEYDNYLGPSLRLLEEGAKNQQITEYLSQIVGEYMGLGDKGIENSKPVLFAEKLRSWYEKMWPGSHV